MGIVQHIGELVLILAQRSNRQLRGHAGFLQPRIRGHKANFVDADSLRTSERGLQLQRQLGRFGFAGGKSAREPANLFFRNGGKELDASQACRREQLGELLFRWRSFQRHAIQQKCVFRGPEQQPCVCPHGNGRAQFLPGDLQLFVGPGVLVAVQAGKFQQNVQASYEGASCRCFWVLLSSCAKSPRL